MIRTRWYVSKLIDLSTLSVEPMPPTRGPAILQYTTPVVGSNIGVWSYPKLGIALCAFTHDIRKSTDAAATAAYKAMTRAPDDDVFGTEAPGGASFTNWSRRDKFQQIISQRYVDVTNVPRQGSIKDSLRGLARNILVYQSIEPPVMPLNTRLSALPKSKQAFLSRQKQRFPGFYPKQMTMTLGQSYGLALQSPDADFGLDSGAAHCGRKDVTLKV